ncbi:MAG TPA: septal ring lytic transglycosylase RlpA family protein [Solirubrobacterales bacterium]|nr:septal ring lytic transglycosylase RlpA family protein [Solirubrobacterales bacterium]
MPSRNRLARKTDSRRAPRPERRSPRRLRWAASLAALSVLAFGVGSAQAAPGGTSPVVSTTAGQDLVFSPFKSAGASWYGPGLYGNKTACGPILRATTIGVAHRTLPCGTMVKFVYEGSAVVAPVIDRGPFVKGRAWDLTAAASEALGFDGVGMLRYAVAVSYARAGVAR